MAKTIRQSLRGRSDFVSDIYIKGMLYGTTIRSPYPHARIVSVDSSGLPDDVTLVTARDIAGINELSIDGESMPILADGVCRYVGEPVALLAGSSQQAVVAAAGQLVVEYAELPAIIAPDQSQPAHVTAGRRGDADAGLAKSHQVVQGSYRTDIQEHMYNEPQGAVAEPQGSWLGVHCATQWPYHVRETIANALQMRPSSCVVTATATGVDLDGKLWYPSLVAAHAALLARRSGEPVKLVYSNLEDFQFTSKRAPFTVTHLTGLDENGTIVAAKIEIAYNTGAYSIFTREIIDRLTATGLGLYTCPDLTVTVRAYTTHLPPLNVLSGFGTAATYFAMETHASRIAELTRSDPREWRVHQFAVQKGRDHDDVRARVSATMDSVVENSDFARKTAAYELQKKRREDGPVLDGRTRGIGLAVASQGSGFAGQNESRYASTISVLLQGNGTAVLRSSITPAEGLRAYWISLVAEGLGLERNKVKLETGRTGAIPDSGPATLSRALSITSRLIEQACATIQRRRFRNPLPIEVKRSYRSPRVSSWEAESLSGNAFASNSVASAVVEISVDPVSFESQVDDVWISVDAGRVISEDQAKRALEMSIYQALEWAMHEQVRFTNGAVDRRGYISYRISNNPPLPGIHITLLPSPQRAPRGIVSLPYNCLPAALAAAVSQATGRYMDRIPTNPELIHGYLESE